MQIPNDLTRCPHHEAQRAKESQEPLCPDGRGEDLCSAQKLVVQGLRTNNHLDIMSGCEICFDHTTENQLTHPEVLLSTLIDGASLPAVSAELARVTAERDSLKAVLIGIVAKIGEFEGKVDEG